MVQNKMAFCEKCLLIKMQNNGYVEKLNFNYNKKNIENII